MTTLKLNPNLTFTIENVSSDDRRTMEWAMQTALEVTLKELRIANQEFTDGDYDPDQKLIEKIQDLMARATAQRRLRSELQH
jgi:hypothetical protein